MATFSKASFNTLKYAAARPTYPRQLFDFIFRFHEHIPETTTLGKAHWDLAVDLGCGTGQATIELHPFKRVIGVDPSAKMVEGAKKYIISNLGEPHVQTKSQFDFIQSPAEKLDFLEDGSVDLVVTAQAAHWFDWQKLWPELARVLRKDATAAVWGYSEFRLTRYPSLTPMINAYSQGSDPATSLGPHWEQPGRRILDNHLQDIPSANAVVPGSFQVEERIYFTGEHHPSLPNPSPVILRRKTTWEGFEAYLRSFSSLHTFHERYPADTEREDGDIASRFIADLRTKMQAVDHERGTGNIDEVEIEWPLALIMVRRT